MGHIKVSYKCVFSYQLLNIKNKLHFFNRSLNVKKLSKLFDNDRLSLEMLEKLGFKRQNNRLILQYQVLNSSTITENNGISDHDQHIYDTEENNNTYNDNNDNYNINQVNHTSDGDKNNIKSNSDSGNDVDVVTKSRKVQNNPEAVAIEFKKRLDEAIKTNNAFQLDQWIEKQQIQVMFYLDYPLTTQMRGL